jgi:hypothetical protein
VSVFEEEPHLESTTIADAAGINLAAVSAAGALKVAGTVQYADNFNSGVIAAVNAYLTIPTSGCSSVGFSLLGSWTGTLIFEATIDQVNWFPILAESIATNVLSYTTTVTGLYTANCGGFQYARVRSSALASGAVNVACESSIGVYDSKCLQLGSWNVGINNFPVAQDANLSVTGTATAGMALTVTLPSVASQYHHVVLLEIQTYTTAARTGGTTPVLVTSTNLPGSNVWTFSSAAVVGTSESKVFSFSTPYRSTTAGTATTIVCPATTSVIWRVNIMYYTGV